MRTNEICSQITNRLEREHEKLIFGYKKPLLLISAEYPGLWLEHVYDSVIYAELDNSKLYLAENATEVFMDYQKEDGQLPYAVKSGESADSEAPTLSYYQIQECVSFASLCLRVYRMNRSKEYLKKAYTHCGKWVNWLKKNRMTRGEGLVEMFVGFDTGHDNSGRLEGMRYPTAQIVDGARLGAERLPDCEVAPIIAVDMNCNLYSSLISLSEMAKELGIHEEADRWLEQARSVKQKLFGLCFNKEDCFFYDVDKSGKQRKYLSSTVFHLFMEGVLDKDGDSALIGEIYERHISNKEEFNTPYPYPAMAINDPSGERHKIPNSWGYYSQGLIALRATLWMDKYGLSKELDNLCEKWVEAWTRCYDRFKLGQELDPITGEPSGCSEWYSSTMLFYLFAAERLKNKL
jgi:hypothetical protein